MHKHIRLLEIAVFVTMPAVDLFRLLYRDVASYHAENAKLTRPQFAGLINYTVKRWSTTDENKKSPRREMIDNACCRGRAEMIQ